MLLGSAEIQILIDIVTTKVGKYPMEQVEEEIRAYPNIVAAIKYNPLVEKYVARYAPDYGNDLINLYKKIRNEG